MIGKSKIAPNKNRPPLKENAQTCCCNSLGNKATSPNESGEKQNQVGLKSVNGCFVEGIFYFRL